jgi:RNA polymerase sigma-70 factor, ECF subfamily
MSAVKAAKGRVEAGVAVAALRAGDEAAFGELTESYRRELQLHCCRLLGSFEESEDLVQEAFLRAWRKRRSFQGRSSFRRWLYAIATNACLDVLKRRKRVVLRHDGAQPLVEIAAPESEPEAEVVARERIELALTAANQLLPPKERAVLIARKVLGWSAAETAAVLGVSVPAVNSALQRALATLRQHRTSVLSHLHTGEHGGCARA